MSVSAAAHEIGTTQATATFYSTGVYQIDIAVDPDALLMKLAVFSGQPIPGAVNRTGRDRRIVALATVFRLRGGRAFDDVPDQPRVTGRAQIAGSAVLPRN